jgi:hypothetical protein
MDGAQTGEGDEDIQERRLLVREEIRSRLGLPHWSNLRGDDVIALTEALDEASRVRLNELFVELREIEDSITK